MTGNTHLLASDYDGTLSRNRTVSDENIAAIKKWQAAGNLFVICTGRGYRSIFEVLEKYDLKPDYFILNNGAAAASFKGEYLFQHLIPQGYSERLFNLLRPMGCKHITVTGADGDYLYYRENDPAPNEHAREPAEVFSYGPYTQVAVHFRDEPEKSPEAEKMILENLPALCPNRNHANIDCTAAGLNKGTGVAQLAEHFHLSPAQCHTIGDGMNDYPMLARFDGAVIEDTNETELLEAVNLKMPSVAAYIEYLLKNS